MIQPFVDLVLSQALALSAIKKFLASSKQCFLLRGSAGTGKTTLVAHIIRHLESGNRLFELLAPTGRAARILGAKTHAEASTIHKRIYTLTDVQVFESARSANDPGMRLVFPLKHDDPGETFFIVDEASMVGDKESKGDLLDFGSGRLLADLIQYGRFGRKGREGDRGAKILFVGDPAQLPPVGETLSPTLSAEYLRETFGLECDEFELIEVMRQVSDSAILSRATVLRNAIGSKTFNTFDVSSCGEEIASLTVSDAVSMVEEALRTKKNSVFITYTNAQALELNRAVRGRLWDNETASLRAKDLLLVNKNSAKTGLYNGDLVKVLDATAQPEHRSVAIKGIEHPVELVFRRVAVAFRAADDQTIRIDCRVLENLLDSPERDLAPIEQRALLVDFRQRYPDLQPKTAEFRMAISQDEYFNALQVKYGYALTCHKAQGGEWDTVVVNFGGGRGQRNEEFFRWTYTAITRARKKLVTIDAPKFDATSEMTWSAVPPSSTIDESAQSAAKETDPDWNRFSFNHRQEGLFAYHLALREAWVASGIAIDRLEHLQYCERYTLARNGQCASVQYQYKGNLKVSGMATVPGSVSDPDFLATALEGMKQVFRSPVGPGAVIIDPFLVEFKDKVERALDGSEVRLVSSQSLQYRLRLDFERAGRRAQIDFHYDGKKEWTRAEEVGGWGASGGLIARVRELMVGS